MLWKASSPGPHTSAWQGGPKQPSQLGSPAAQLKRRGAQLSQGFPTGPVGCRAGGLRTMFGEAGQLGSWASGHGLTWCADSHRGCALLGLLRQIPSGCMPRSGI